jgi:hypothetical protein
MRLLVIIFFMLVNSLLLACYSYYMFVFVEEVTMRPPGIKLAHGRTGGVSDPGTRRTAASVPGALLREVSSQPS